MRQSPHYTGHAADSFDRGCFAVLVRFKLADAVRNIKEFRAVLARFKLGSSMGANIGVQPRGDELSHGTERFQYPSRSPSSTPDGQDPGMSSRLWNISDVDHLAPGRADGSFGQEVIG